MFRVLTMVYAAALIIRDDEQYAHPAFGLIVIAVMVCWTAVTVAAVVLGGFARAGLRGGQAEILRLVATGLTYPQVAARLTPVHADGPEPRPEHAQ